MRSIDAQLEISVWHNGKAVTGTGIVYTSRIMSGSEESWWMHNPNSGNSHSCQVRIRWDAETADDWYSGELWLLDANGLPIAHPRPTLVYIGASDLPMTTAFLCGWENHTPTKAGVWVVAIRRADTTYQLKRKYGVE